MLPGIRDIVRHAIFLDLDGTLAELAEHPDSVQVDPATVCLLRALQDRTGDALAVISGREIAVIDRLLHPLVLPAAGVHGLQRRDGAGVMRSGTLPDLTPIADLLGETLGADPGLVIERKHGALAVHYRQRPNLERRCRDVVEDILRHRPDMRLVPGKMVVELAYRGSDKGSAIAAFLAEPPFSGRTPIFAGDDATDEAGFAVVNAHDGISIKVGGPPTAARFQAGSILELQAWLGALAGAPQAEQVR